MGALLREALRRLCTQTGWSYAVFWNAIRCGNSRHLIWEEGHHEQSTRASAVTSVSTLETAESLLKGCRVFRGAGDDGNPLAELPCQAEDRVGVLVNKMMRSQVHVVGDGVVGRAAVTGNHQWIVQSGEGYVLEGLGEMNQQFSAGIKTIAVIPVLPHGVVQLGSIQMIMENMSFIDHVRQFFLQLGNVPGALLYDGVLKDLDLKNEMSVVGLNTSLYQSGSACSNLSNLLPFNNENLLLQVDRFPMINPLSQPSLMSGRPLLDKVPVNSKPAAPIVGMPIHNGSDQAVIPSIPCHHGQPEGQAVLSIKDMQHQLTQVHGLGCGSQHQHSFVGLSSRGLSYLEGQLLPNIGQQRFLNSVPTSDSTKTIQLQPYGKTISSSLKNATILPGNEELSNSGNPCGISVLLPCGMEKDTTGIRNVNSYAMTAAQLLSSMNCSRGNSSSAEVERRNTDKHTKSMSTATVSNIGNDFFQTLENSCIDPKISPLCSGPLTFCAQDCWVNGSDPIRSTQASGNYACVGISDSVSKNGQKDYEHKPLNIVGDCTPDKCIPHVSGDDLFDVLGMDFKSKHCSGGLDTFVVNVNGLSTGESGICLSTCISQLEVDPIFEATHDGISSCSGIFSETGPDQLLDAVVCNINLGAKQNLDDDFYCKTVVTKTNDSMVHMSSGECGWASLQQQMHGEHAGPSPHVLKVEPASSSVKSAGSVGKTGECSQQDATYKSQISLWVENGQDMKIDSMLSAQCKRVDEVGKSNRKRPRPGESPRPRPKDRQMIQDRVKELREIVPNGAKCSIDALLERTIKHMLFLQSVTKHADKLKETGEPKIISKEGGLLLKDNFEGGATWAFEVGTQSMVCPIIVEDLKPPRQLLVEMLCEERGFFLEIADLIRGLGLTILKGVMEARNDKVWARFAVEANRDVTRMDIFMSLVRLLEPNAGSSVAAQGFDNSNVPCNIVCQPSVPATGLANRLQ